MRRRRRASQPPGLDDTRQVQVSDSRQLLPADQNDGEEHADRHSLPLLRTDG